MELRLTIFYSMVMLPIFLKSGKLRFKPGPSRVILFELYQSIAPNKCLLSAVANGNCSSSSRRFIALSVLKNGRGMWPASLLFSTFVEVVLLALGVFYCAVPSSIFC